jgi:HEPN domain-containing protein
LLNLGRKGDPLSRAPGRLVAQHAIELYLNAFLIMKGEDRKSLRDHDLADRANRAKSASLGLRKRTLAHLVEMTTKREYLVTRYAPELTTTLSEINRLMATVEEVARKVGSPRP